MHDAPMTDPLDREIARLLDVAPSVDFVARARRRIAHNGETERASPTWTTTVAAAWAAALVIALIVAAARAGRRGGEGDVPLAARRLAPLAGAVAAGSAGAERPPSAAGIRRRGATGAVARHVEPEVLIDRVEARAIRAVLDNISAGRIDLTPLEPADAEIHIAPVDVPLIVGDRKEPDRP